MSKKKKVLINKYSIINYSLNELDIVTANSRKNRDGLPLFYPTKNEIEQRMILSFVNATIHDRNGKQVDEEVANFNILEEDHFDSKDPLAITKIKFIVALLTPNYIVEGGVYYKGCYFTKKMTPKKALFLMKSFLNSYFHIEDIPYIKEYFLPQINESLPFWPTKSKDGKVTLIFAAVNALVKTKEGEDISGPHNFEVYANDTFDLTKEEDRTKVAVIRSLLDEERIVSGFYYKGNLLAASLTKAFKLYLEKSFIKKNFTVNQRDFLLTSVTKDAKTGLPLFWPMKDNNGREIVVSVLNGSSSKFDNTYNFDIYSDEPFDLNNPEAQKKFEVIRTMLFDSKSCTGGVYLDGLLIPGYLSGSEIEHHKDKVEKALKIYLTDSESFIKINQHFTTSDRDRILRLSPRYAYMHLDNFTKVKKVDRNYKADSDIIFKLNRANIVDGQGNLVFKENLTGEFTLDNLSKEVIELLEYILDENYIPRGEIFFKGDNLVFKKKAKLEELKSLISEKYPGFAVKPTEKETSLVFESKSLMPAFWPIKDSQGRNVLLSVVDADVHFKTPHGIVKAVNNASFDIYEGETFGLVGESGSGKTTISRAILGINKLSKGGIYYRGKLISTKLSKKETMTSKKNIQMIFQDPAASLNERANIDYIVSEGLYNFKLFKTKEERLEKITNMLNQVGLLPEHLSRYPHEFSGGQRQRIGIARALVIEPQLVLADEPISALDVSIRAQVLNLLKKLQKDQGLTYLFIAHDLSIIRYISDRIAVMHNGYIVELGNAEEIYSNPLHPYTRSLLTAIPQPDPKTKDSRKKIVYQMGDTKYEECRWVEVSPNHYVLLNDKIEADIKRRLGK